MTTQELWEKMVEEAARAIVSEMGPIFGPPERLADQRYVARQNEMRMTAAKRHARAALIAALKVMREPSESMIKYGEFNLDGCRADECDKGVLHTYRTMLDEMIRAAEGKQ